MRARSRALPKISAICSIIVMKIFFCESADGTLELSLRASNTLGELRDDEPAECGCIAQMLDNSPLVQNGMIAVPKAIGSEGGDE